MAVPTGAATGRREQILTVAARLFARHGFHGVSIADLGAAVGVSGPALYRHFPGKEALLAEMLVGISEHLLAGGRERATVDGDARATLEALVDFHLDFALTSPDLIVVQDRDLANLPPSRGAGFACCSVPTSRSGWTCCGDHPGLTPEAARIAAHGAFGLLNSTPHSGARGSTREVAALLRGMALTALTTLPAA
ncbi:TetR/AcrR family transcriptional regulator [Pseudonocardia benzenivorans]